MTLVRQAVDADLPALLGIYNHAIATSTAVFEYDPHTLEMRRAWLHDKHAANLPVLVALDADAGVVGFATYGSFRAKPAYRQTIEHSVYVAEQAWRRGIARQLMEALIADARERRYHAMIAGVVVDNEPSLRFHEAMGFVEVAHFREVGFKFGRWLDLKFLELLL